MISETISKSKLSTKEMQEGIAEVFTCRKFMINLRGNQFLFHLSEDVESRFRFGMSFTERRPDGTVVRRGGCVAIKPDGVFMALKPLERISLLTEISEAIQEA